MNYFVAFFTMAVGVTAQQVAIFLVGALLFLYLFFRKHYNNNKLFPIDYVVIKVNAIVFAPQPISPGNFEHYLRDVFFQKIVIQKSNESNSAYEYRKSQARWFGPTFRFELDGVAVDLRLSTGETTQAEVHRILVYMRKFNSSPKLQGYGELKIKYFHDNKYIKKNKYKNMLVKCLNNGPYTLSIIAGKFYNFMGESIVIHGVKFLKICDESTEDYFYPHYLFDYKIAQQ
jgi:hypothetical protein